MIYTRTARVSWSSGQIYQLLSCYFWRGRILYVRYLGGHALFTLQLRYDSVDLPSWDSHGLSLRSCLAGFFGSFSLWWSRTLRSLGRLWVIRLSLVLYDGCQWRDDRQTPEVEDCDETHSEKDAGVN